MIRLMNSAMMPKAGHYRLTQISIEEFTTLLKSNEFVSYIGYKETARLIEPIIEKPVPLSRKTTDLNDGDVLVIVRLKYRVDAESKKGSIEPDITDFEFFKATYSEKNNTDYSKYIPVFQYNSAIVTSVNLERLLEIEKTENAKLLEKIDSLKEQIQTIKEFYFSK